MKILKNHHRPISSKSIPLPKWVNKNKPTTMKRIFLFTESCLYDLHDEDQHDVNKMFGFSIGLHHKTSFRFGWRPILENGTIEIVAYEYHDGLRQRTIPICEVQLLKEYQFELKYHPVLQLTEYGIEGNSEKEHNIKYGHLMNDVELIKKHGLGYTLGLYFGGNEKAPQDIIIYTKRK